MNLGSFGQGPGTQDALQQAIQARSQGSRPVPQLNQTMQGSPQPPQVPQTGGEMATPTAKTPVTEAEIILKAFDSRLKTISKIEEANLAPKIPQAVG